jgi:parallel beta helix pectate lyase-like protein
MRGNAFVLVALAVLCPLTAASAAPSARKAELLARAPRLKATPAAAKVGGSPVVDCTKGDSLQTAIDKSLDGDVIEVRGLCNENVKVLRKRLTLHGLDPLTDGIAGVAATPPTNAALEVWYSDNLRVENLSFVHPTGHGLGLWYSAAEALNCRMVGNPRSGIHVSVSSFLNATELTLSDNGQSGLSVQRNASGFCRGCQVHNNTAAAATANTGSILSLLDSVVTGLRGVRAFNNSYADIDCVSEDNPAYSCSLNVTRTAGAAFSNSTAAMFGAGPFAGQLQAGDHGEILVYGSQQTSTGLGPSGNPLPNVLDAFSTLLADPSPENGLESQLAGHTVVSTFSRALLRSATTVNGTLACDSAGDAWKDPGVTVTGGPITGCEHVP